MFKAMRGALTGFLLVVFLMQTFSSLVVYANYLVNKEYIATTLCENREMPEMKCDGKCYLRKQLQQHHEEKESPASPREKHREIILFSVSVEPAPGVPYNLADVKSGVYRPVSSEKHIHAVFHPPLSLS